MAERASSAAVPRLSEWRVRRLMTQTELAAASKLSRVTVNKAEHGGRLSFPTIRQLADALGVSTDDLRYPDRSPS